METTNVRIEKLVVKPATRFTWLKYVTGTDLDHHCAKSLLGTYEKRWHRYGNRPIWGPLTLPVSPFYYFCAVTPRWETNVHVAWRAKAGARMVIDTPLVYMEVQNAEEIPITKDYINWKLLQSQDVHYNTCRNWWFANYLKATYNI